MAWELLMLPLRLADKGRFGLFLPGKTD